MKKLIIGLLAVVLVLVPLAACAGEDANHTSPGWNGDQATEEYVSSPSTPMPPTEPSTPGSGESKSYDGGVEYYDEETTPSSLVDIDSVERMIVRNGDISLVVEDIEQSLESITQMASAFGGWVVSSYISGEEEETRGWITFRVPEDKFDTALEQLHDLAVRVESEQTSAYDVTEEYIDLQARLENAEATEQQYLVLLDKAEDVEDTLSIYSYLTRIREEIETLKGRIQYLEQTTSTSMISVYLEPETTDKPLVRVGWSALEVLKSAARGLVSAGQVLGTILIWILIFIPVWGTVLGIFLWRRHKRKQANK